MARIVQVLADGRPGGGTTAVFELCRLLAGQGEDVAVITQRDSSLATEAAKAGLCVFGLDFAKRRRSVALALELSRLLARLNPAVVHAHGARAALPIALLPKARGRQFVYTVHGFHFVHKPPVISWLARAAEALCIGRADCTVFVSDADFAIAKRSRLLALSRTQRVIKNAVSVDVAAVAAAKIYDIGFLGRLHPQKNPLILVDILKALPDSRLTLCVIGGGSLAAELEARIAAAGLSDRVTLTGECDRAAALATLSSCEVLVLPSRWEGHPIALIEAMLLGLPVIASNIAGNDEIVVDGETGYLVPPSDVTAYAERLSSLLDDPALRAAMGQKAQQRARREYSVRQMVDAHRQVYGSAGADLAVRLRPA